MERIDGLMKRLVWMNEILVCIEWWQDVPLIPARPDPARLVSSRLILSSSLDEENPIFFLFPFFPTSKIFSYPVVTPFRIKLYRVEDISLWSRIRLYRGVNFSEISTVTYEYAYSYVFSSFYYISFPWISNVEEKNDKER